MNALSAPKNLTRNVLIGMTAGVLVASAFYYLHGFISEDISVGVEKYIFNLGGQIFKNLLLLVLVLNTMQLCFFFLVFSCTFSHPSK